MRKKKIISLALVLALLVTMLAGCGGSKKDDKSGKTTLKLGIWPTEDLAQDIPMFEGYQKTFEEKYKDVIVYRSTKHILKHYTLNSIIRVYITDIPVFIMLFYAFNVKLIITFSHLYVNITIANNI